MRILTIVGHNTMTEPRVKHIVRKYYSRHTWITSTESDTQIVYAQMQTLKVIAVRMAMLRNCKVNIAFNFPYLGPKASVHTWWR